MVANYYCVHGRTVPLEKPHLYRHNGLWICIGKYTYCHGLSAWQAYDLWKEETSGRTTSTL